LADKHRVRVWLGRRAPHGTTASVLLPAELVREAPPVSFARQPEPDVPTQGAPPERAPAGPRARPDEPRRTGGPTPDGPRTSTLTADGPRAAGPRAAGPRAAGSPAAGPRTGGMTPGGLPRRVPTSLRVPDSPAGIVAPPHPPGNGPGDGFFADLADFDAGERAARGTLPELDHPDPEDPKPDDPRGGPREGRPSDD
ncbi:hypothetical protein ACFV4N_41015, partial [Actinosynnema sp. NPDC059797]